MKMSSFLWVLLTAMTVISCRKNDRLVDSNTPGTAEDKIKDTILNFSREAYLWHTQIPADFNARSYDGPEEIMQAIRAYSTEAGFNDPVDHYSMAFKKVEWDNVSSGVASDFGLNVFFFNDNDLRVRSVEKTSPAGIAGIKRGWRITKVAGNTNITPGNSDFLIDNIYNSAATEFTFEKPDGSSVDISLECCNLPGKSNSPRYSLFSGRKNGWLPCF